MDFYSVSVHKHAKNMYRCEHMHFYQSANQYKPIPLSLSLSFDLLSLSAFSDWACTLSDFVDFLSLSLSSFFLHSVLGCFFSSGGGVFSSFQRGKAWRRSFQISTVLPHLQRKDNDINYIYT